MSKNPKLKKLKSKIRGSEIKCIFIEKEDPEGPYGARGLGEHVLIPTAPAILNALRNATGAIITKLPALPHRVLEAISKAKNDKS